ECVSLLKQVRDRAGLSTAGNGWTKESFRTAILDERSWEFYGENMRRRDLIRHGLFISKAKERLGNFVDDHFLVFPIPQTEVNANALCGQNPGY
ncbi:MAG: RagB/SusD family nutrient uptake outer membrane protein, partial [Bacteroidales bacterium]|nr:RagB/SusD family nutrient uptake outer membrane protein [Bacteroidales bacterium]